MLKLARRARGHFVMLIEIRVHLSRVKPGHISANWKKEERNLQPSGPREKIRTSFKLF